MARATRSTAPAVDLDGWLAGFTATMSSAQPYREPTQAEGSDAAAGLHLMLGGGDAGSRLGPLGFTVVSGLDSESGRPFTLAFSEAPPGDRAWAAVLVDAAEPTRMIIGCPHPVFDRASERLGLALWRRSPGSLLLVAGAHREAGAGLADPRDHPGSLFHRIAVLLLGAGLPHLQVHGFADASAPGVDVVLSPGPTTAGVPITRMADSLAGQDLPVVRAWQTPMPNLDGTTNIQGRAAALAGAVFVHVELSASARRSRATQVIDGLAGADLAGTGWPGPVLAQPVAGQFPAAVGAANATGTSPYGARADHRHAERQATLDRIAAIEAAADRIPQPPVVLDYAADLTIVDAGGRSFAVTATGPLTVTLRGAAPADGATTLLEVVADGTEVPVAFAPGTGMLEGLAAPFVVRPGRLGLFALRHSARAGRWTLVTAGIER
jgi:hypothetical protein